MADLSSVSEILIVKPSSLGDVVHTLPAVRAMRRACPGASFRWIVNREWAPLLAGNPDLAEIIEFPRSEFRGVSSARAFWQWTRPLRGLRPDLALDFQGLLRSGFFARISGAREILCLSNAELLNRLSATRVVPMRRDEHAVDRYLRVPAALGVARPDAVEFPLPEGDPVTGADIPPRFLLLHPFSRGIGKSLTPAQVRKFCEGAGLPVLIAGRSNIELPEMPGNLLNATTLSQLIWLIRRAAFVVSVDSGPMHIAAAITPRLLSIHTWSDPRLVGPYNPEAWVWKGGEIRQMKDMTWDVATRTVPFDDSQLPGLLGKLQRLLA